MKILYYLCLNTGCEWFRDLIILKVPEVAPGVINVPHLVCDCGMEPIPLRVRDDV